MKKSVIALILLAVLIIIVSPGIVGKFAEESVGENLNWAAEESGELVVTSEGFDRGWFSSEGQHRVALGDGQIRAAFAIDDDDATPALLIDTRIDHGLIAVSSMNREEGSLAPSLGKAISTLSIDDGNGNITALPGKVYSNVGLGGDLDSRFVLEAGSHSDENGEVTWQPSNINVTSSAQSGDIEFDGSIGALSFGGNTDAVTIDGITFSGDQTKTQYGFHVGDVALKMGKMSVSNAGMDAGGVNGLTLAATSSVDDGAMNAAMQFNTDSQEIPGFGKVSIDADMKMSVADAAAVGRVTERMEQFAGSSDPTAMLTESEEEFKDMFASGLSLNFDKLDVSLPMGLVESTMLINIPASDRDSFEWTSLLLNLEGKLDLKVPESLVQMATSMNPMAGSVVAMGYLKKDGDSYVMDAEMKKGLLKVNGVPIPIPLGAF